MIMSLLPNVYTNLFPLIMVLSIVLHIYYPILLMKTVSCYNLFYSHFNCCMSSYYVYYCYFMSCCTCIYFLCNRGFQINNNNNNNGGVSYEISLIYQHDTGPSEGGGGRGGGGRGVHSEVYLFDYYHSLIGNLKTVQLLCICHVRKRARKLPIHVCVIRFDGQSTQAHHNMEYPVLAASKHKYTY